MTKRIIKIEGDETLIRDEKTNAVLNADISALQQYRARRNNQLQLQNDVENLKQDMSEIKNLLRQLVDRD